MDWLDRRWEEGKNSKTTLLHFEMINACSRVHHMNHASYSIKTLKLDGVVAANTSVNRNGLRTKEETLNEFGWPGGLSGKPLTERSTKVIQYLYKQLGDEYPIIGVGGIHSEKDALEKINAGAKLIQVYTGFIYEGPGLIKRINKAIIQ